MIKVLHYRNTSGLYGADRWIIALFKNMKNDKIENILLTPSNADPSLNNEVKNLSFKTFIMNIKKNYNLSEHIYKLCKIIKQENIDILHTHDYKSDIIGYYAAKKCRIPIISTLHGFSKEKNLKLRLFEYLEKIFLKKFDKVIAHSKRLAEEAKLRKSIIIPNGIDLSELKQIKKTKTNSKTIGYIGQLIKRKRIQDLVIAFKYVRKKQENSKLVIIGDGSQRKELEKLTNKLGLTNNTSFRGFRSDRLSLLTGFDVFILPSLLEGIPRALMEAMALEIPVIATNIEGNKILIKDNETGLLVDPKSPKQIADRALFLLNNKEKAKKIGKNAKNFIEKNFSAELMAKRYEKLYLDIK